MAEGYMLGVKAGIEGYHRSLVAQGRLRQDPPRLVDVQTIERDEAGRVIKVVEHKAFASFTTAADCACGGACGCHQ